MDGIQEWRGNDGKWEGYQSEFMTDGEIPEQLWKGLWHSVNKKNAFIVFPLAERYYIKTIKMWDRVKESAHPELQRRKVGARVYIHEHENAS